MIDIREESVQDHDEIRFASDSDTNGCILEVNHRFDKRAVRIVDGEGLGDDRVLIEDIDNFIKALKKAKELWG